MSLRTEPYCCKIGCEAPAEFEIHAERARAMPPFVSVAGPDPYADSTHACEAHVGELLGHQVDAPEQEHICWRVHPLEPATLYDRVEALNRHHRALVAEGMAQVQLWRVARQVEDALVWSDAENRRVIGDERNPSGEVRIDFDLGGTQYTLVLLRHDVLGEQP